MKITPLEPSVITCKCKASIVYDSPKFNSTDRDSEGVIECYRCKCMMKVRRYNFEKLA